MTADKLCNAPQRAVLDMLEGAVALNPSAVMLDAVDQVSIYQSEPCTKQTSRGLGNGCSLGASGV